MQVRARLSPSFLVRAAAMVEPSESENRLKSRFSREALSRTRTVDPLITIYSIEMAVIVTGASLHSRRN